MGERGFKRFMTPKVRKLGRARELRKTQTDAELRLWKFLRNRGTAERKFRRQYAFGPYFLDFVCLEQKLVIEVDGSQHFAQSEYDDRRTAWLKERGFRVLRFWNIDVFTQTDAVMQTIFDALTAPHPNPLPVSGARE